MRETPSSSSYARRDSCLAKRVVPELSRIGISRLKYAMTRFIEGDGVPSDATVVDQTWRFVNKNGGPDRRFNNNVQLPIVNYGVLRFSSANGLNIHLEYFECRSELSLR